MDGPLGVRLLFGLGKALRVLPLPALREASDSGLAGIAYDLNYAISASLWRARSDMPRWRELQDDWRRALAAMEPGVPAAPVDPPALRLITDNAEAYRRRTELYASAQRSIDVSTYAIYGDATGWKTVRELVDRAKAGVRVRVQIDDGIAIRKSATTEGYAKLLTSLVDGGVHLSRYRDPARPYDMNHRKLLVIDGEVAIVGGRNYGDAYAGPHWRDVEIECRGDIAATCAAMFESSWARQEQGGPLAPPVRVTSIAAGSGRCVETRGDLSRVNPVLLWQLALFDAATTSIDLENAYVVAVDIVAERLIAAARRGVRVRLFTNSRESNDVKTASHAFFSRFPSLVERGVELWLRQGEGKTLHSKYAIVDRRFVSLGSYNMNAHSARFAAEANLQLDHPPLAAELTAHFERGLGEARRVASVEEARSMIPGDPVAIVSNRVFLDFQ